MALVRLRKANELRPRDQVNVPSQAALAGSPALEGFNHEVRIRTRSRVLVFAWCARNTGPRGCSLGPAPVRANDGPRPDVPQVFAAAGTRDRWDFARTTPPAGPARPCPGGG